MPIKDVHWVTILERVTAEVEAHYDLSLGIDEVTVEEVTSRAKETLSGLNMSTIPKVAKAAGHTPFWIRKLKPISHLPESRNHFALVNELIGLLVGISICRHYFAQGKGAALSIQPRVLHDWVVSMRFNSHSPHSTAISFEHMADP